MAGVVRRLGAVLSIDEALAELAVRTRRRTLHPGQLAKALTEGKVIKAFAFRGSMLYLSPEDGGIYRPPIAGAPVGVAELGGLLPAHSIGLARLPCRGTRCARDGPLTVVELANLNETMVVVTKNMENMS